MSTNPVSDLVVGFQNLVAQVPDLLQPVIVAVAGAVPFVEGEGGALVGIVGGLHPLVAAPAAALGNFLAVLAVVALSARVRGAIVDRRGGGKEKKPKSKGRLKFERLVVRFGVPGASLLGPSVLPTHFTAAALVASGVPKGKVLLWQTIAIVLWTALVTAAITGIIAIAV